MAGITNKKENSMDLIEKTLSTEVIYNGRIIKVERDEVLLPNKTYAKREIVRHSEAVAILAVDKEDNVYMVEQFRKPIDSVILEIPAGHIEKGEEPEKTALRELEEETGMKANKIRLVNKYFTSPGFTDELIYFYIAEDLVPVSPHTDEDEFINIKKIPFNKLQKMAFDGELSDVKALLAIYFYSMIKNG